jgi:basic amino acid/polyamine antiporter, APA family
MTTDGMVTQPGRVSLAPDGLVTAAARPPLARKLGLFPATNIVVANMVGAGIFTTSGLLMQQLGDPGLMLILWIAGGVLALSGALCYGELAAAMPRAGGEYAYLAELFHPLLGFLTGWVSFFVGFSAPLAASSLGFSEYVGRALPQLVDGADAVFARKALAVVIITLLAIVHLRGVDFGARVQNVLTVGKVVLIAGLIAVGFALGSGTLDDLARPTADAVRPVGWKSIGLSLMWIMFAYSGWNASAYVGSEIRDPERTLPRSLLVGTGVVILLYVGLNLLFVYATSPAELEGVIAVGGLAASRLFGPTAETVISGLIAFALLSSISALIMLGPRVYYAMAKDGYFFRAVADVHPVTRVPSTSIVLQCLIAGVMVMSGTFDQILTYMGFCLGIFPIVAVIGLFRLRRAGPSPYRMPAFPLPPLLFAVASVVMLVLAFLERPMESSIAIATVVAGVPFYLLFRRSRRAVEAQPGTPAP